MEEKNYVNYAIGVEGPDYVSLVEQKRFSEIPTETLLTFLSRFENALIKLERKGILRPEARDETTEKIKGIQEELEKRRNS